MSQAIVLLLPYPISANRYWATRVIKRKGAAKSSAMTYVTKEAEAYKAGVGWRAKAAGVREPLRGRVHIHLKLYPERPQDWAKRSSKDPDTWDDTVRCLDLDNARKVVYDALKGVVIVDDRQVFAESGERMEPDAHGARLEVTVSTYQRGVVMAPDLFDSRARAHVSGAA